MSETINFKEPPADLPAIQRGNWFDIPEEDEVQSYLKRSQLAPVSGAAWQAARLSKAAYLYRDVDSGWSVVVKYYGVKTGRQGPKHALREFKLTQLACSAWLVIPGYRAVEPLDVWEDVLFLEYIDGLTLEDMISIRKSQPGVLIRCLEQAATLLANLHSNVVDVTEYAGFAHWIQKTRKIIHQLGKHGVLQDDPIIRSGLEKSIAGWEAKRWMDDFNPVPMHGDTTTSNFVFPKQGDVVAIDWERAGYSDPAFDLGRLAAEIAHSIDHIGGDMAEAAAFIEYLVEMYCSSLRSDTDSEALLERAKFYQASSSLRIARNGWVPREDRLRLVGQAFALLT
jgi:tRNA A-37 threonylcarbamoyl transferase component Bud32